MTYVKTLVMHCSCSSGFRVFHIFPALAAQVFISWQFDRLGPWTEYEKSGIHVFVFQQQSTEDNNSDLKHQNTTWSSFSFSSYFSFSLFVFDQVSILLFIKNCVAVIALHRWESLLAPAKCEAQITFTQKNRGNFLS